MDRSTPLTLIKKTFTTDDIGQKIFTETTTAVYANIQSVSRSEFFAAGEQGFKPQFVATMFAPDYEGQDLCELTMFGNTSKYSIYRTYLGANDTIELFLEKKVGK